MMVIPRRVAGDEGSSVMDRGRERPICSLCLGRESCRHSAGGIVLSWSYMDCSVNVTERTRSLLTLP